MVTFWSWVWSYPSSLLSLPSSTLHIICPLSSVLWGNTHLTSDSMFQQCQTILTVCHLGSNCVTTIKHFYMTMYTHDLTQKTCPGTVKISTGSTASFVFSLNVWPSKHTSFHREVQSINNAVCSFTPTWSMKHPCNWIINPRFWQNKTLTVHKPTLPNQRIQNQRIQQDR